jgi:WD40 repeat protein
MWAVAVTPDGTRIVSGADDGTVRIWNIASGHLERTLESHGGRVCAVAVTPDGAGIVSDAGGYRDFTVRIWNLASGRLERALEGYSRDGNAVAVTPYGHRIVTGSIDGKVSVLDLASGREIASWAPDPGIEFETCCTVPTDPALVVYSDSAGGIHILRLLEA